MEAGVLQLVSVRCFRTREVMRRVYAVWQARQSAAALLQFGVKRAQRMLGVKIHTPGTPAPEALAEAAQRYHLSAIRLTVRT